MLSIVNNKYHYDDSAFMDDIWKLVDNELEDSTLRTVLRTNEDKWGPKFARSLNSMMFELKRNYSFELHCITYACWAFSHIAGYERDDEIEKPDFAMLKSSRGKPIMEEYGGSIPQYFKKFKDRITYEMNLRMTNLQTKKLECRDEDRTIAFVCLAFCLVNNASTLYYRRESAYEVFDKVIREYGFEAEFREDLR